MYDGVGMIVVNRAVKTATGVDAPERAHVRIELDKAFASMSFTHRREYVEWVEEAKRADTRARRIAATVERVRCGEPQR